MQDWLENPVTEALKAYSIKQRDEVMEERGLNAYVAYEPQKTQENMAVANAGFVAWDDIVDILNEGEALFDEEDEDE